MFRQGADLTTPSSAATTTTTAVRRRFIVLAANRIVRETGAGSCGSSSASAAAWHRIPDTESSRSVTTSRIADVEGEAESERECIASHRLISDQRRDAIGPSETQANARSRSVAQPADFLADFQHRSDRRCGGQLFGHFSGSGRRCSDHSESHLNFAYAKYARAVRPEQRGRLGQQHSWSSRWWSRQQTRSSADIRFDAPSAGRSTR